MELGKGNKRIDPETKTFVDSFNRKLAQVRVFAGMRIPDGGSKCWFPKSHTVGAPWAVWVPTCDVAEIAET